MSGCRAYLLSGGGFAAGIVVGMIAGAPDSAALAAALREIADHVDDARSDVPEPPGTATVFALVETSALARAEPALADVLADGGPLTPVEQHIEDPAVIDTDGVVDLERYLATTVWPDSVTGCAIVHSILVVPPDRAADGRPAHLFVGVLRSGPTVAFLRVFGESELRTTESLAASLIAAIRATFSGSQELQDGGV